MVPEDTHNTCPPSHQRFFDLQPSRPHLSGNSNLVPYVSLKTLAFATQLGISIDLSCGGVLFLVGAGGIFCNCTILVVRGQKSSFVCGLQLPFPCRLMNVIMKKTPAYDKRN